MSNISESEARERSLELLDLLISIHEETQYADFAEDNEILRIIRTILAELKLETYKIEERSSNLLLLYAKKVFNGIRSFVENCQSRYVNFGFTYEILANAEDIIINKPKNIENLRRTIRELSNELERLIRNEVRLNSEGKKDFFTIFLLACVPIGALFIYFSPKFESDTTGELFLLGVIVLFSFLGLEKIYTDIIIVGRRSVLKRFEYFKR